MKKSFIRIVFPAFALGLALTLVGCKSDGSDEPATQAAVNMGAVNDTCPISGGAVDPDATMAEFNGAKIGFCCNDCVNKWNTWSDAQKSDYTSKNMH